MKVSKIFVVCGLVILISLVFVPLIRANRSRQRLPEPHQSITIVLDAGHGGWDGGATNRDGTIVERDLVLEITQMVEEHLRLQGFHVVMTRYGDEDLASPNARNRKREDLNRRVAIINEVEDDAIAISIHANAIGDRRWSGAQTFYDPSSLENRELAMALMTGLRANIDGLDREERPISNIYVLRHSTIPTALVEVGFLSNPEEARLLADEEYQQLMAYAIFEGILLYVEGLEKE